MFKQQFPPPQTRLRERLRHRLRRGRRLRLSLGEVDDLVVAVQLGVVEGHMGAAGQGLRKEPRVATPGVGLRLSEPGAVTVVLLLSLCSAEQGGCMVLFGL